MPEGLREALSLTIDKGARFCIANMTKTQRLLEEINCLQDYKINIRAMLSKLPGMYFTGFRSASLTSKIVVSETQYKQMIDDFLKIYPNAVAPYNELN